jgi:pyridoxal phosphate enzyme (YggS family)
MSAEKAPAEDSSIAANLERIRERIASACERSGRGVDEITVVAVSKTFPAEAIRSAYEIGLRHFGENRVQEWESKLPRLDAPDATFHLIGHLQSNKARRAANLFHRIDSVDGLALAQKLHSSAREERKKLSVLIEVHLSDESSKSGISESDLPALAEKIIESPDLELLGLMTVPPYFEDANLARPYFRRLRELHDELTQRIGRPLPTLSMGMSHDFEVAIEEGATEIRVGQALFGERTKPVP